MEMIVVCPNCRREWVVPQGTDSQLCNCHLYCEQGSKPSDCSLTPSTFNGQIGYPVGEHTVNLDSGDNILFRSGYCSVHSKFSYKQPVLIECDWESWFSRRAPKQFRDKP